MKKMHCFIVLILATCKCFGQQQIPAYKNASLPVEERVKDLLSRMTIEEKFWQLFMIPGEIPGGHENDYKNGIFGFQVSAESKNGDASQQMLNYETSESAISLARKINALQKYFVEQTRLGIPIIAFDEALHGLVRDGGTAFPQAIGLAATWDTTLMHKVANAIATETKLRGIRQILSPVINIASDVRWGRTEETYGEDPFLTSEMGVAFISAFEKKGIVTTPKHFIANVGDGGRDSYPIHYNERLLDEIYFAPFKAVIERAGARSIMTAYNSLDGSPCTANDWLLNKTLKDKWGFKGFVISDASAVGGANVLHFTSPDYPTSGQQAINNGLDVIFQTSYDHYKLFIPHFLDGGVDIKRMDDAVSRVLRVKFELGLFEHPYVSEEDIAQLSKGLQHKAIAKQAALESIVLLKNDKNVLPLKKTLRSVAVIGEDATEARLGGYSGPGNGKISILDGIKQKAGNIVINYAAGPGRESNEWTVVASKYLSTKNNEEGLQAEYFNNIQLTGKPDLERIDKNINFQWTLFSPGAAINNNYYAGRWTGYIHSPKTGTFKIGLEGNDGYRLYLNDKLITDKWTKQSYSTVLKDFYFDKGKAYKIRIEFYEPVGGNAHLKLIWNAESENNWKQKIQNAVAVAQKSDVAVIAVGIREGEFQDRAMLSLPGHQEELITQVAATGKPVVVLLVGGSAITMSNWIDKVSAIADVWYPGEEGGHAVADVLFGDYTPSGRLPVTFPLHEAQLPLIYNHKPTGRGDDYNNLSGLPLFPFGYGLSYTSFDYSNIHLDKPVIDKTDSVVVSFTIKNTGKFAGDEVVQLYIKDLFASVVRPVMELKGFQRVHLQVNETKKLSFKITPAMLSLLNEKLENVVEPGDFRLMIGSSSSDIRLTENITVK